MTLIRDGGIEKDIFLLFSLVHIVFVV